MVTDSVQAELARYFAHLATVQTNNQSEVSNGASRDFTFNFGSSTLTVQMMEKLEVYVDGVAVTNLDRPVFDVPDPDSIIAGTVVEDGNDDSSLVTAESADGSMKFFDLDTTDTHTVSVIAPAGALGSLTAAITNVATGDGQGTVGWTYTLNDAAAQSLSAGEVRMEEFVVKITDDEGQFATQTVTITITGTNDPPVITASLESGAVSEDALPTTAAGAIDFTDVDLADVHSVSATPAGGGYLGSFDVSVSDDSTGDGAGTVAWNFSVDNAALQFLAAGETLTQTYTVTVNDGLADSNTQEVTITITGTNDAPVISVGAVTVTPPAVRNRTAA